jgi:hypothetical protein
MTDEAIKKRQSRAKEAATEILRKAGYCIIPSDNSNFCVIGTRQTEVRMIKVVIDEITENDIRTIREVRLPGMPCIKEIWCRKGDDFEIREFLN